MRCTAVSSVTRTVKVTVWPGAACAPAAGARIVVTGGAASPIVSTIVRSSLRLPPLSRARARTRHRRSVGCRGRDGDANVAGPDVTGGATGAVPLPTRAPSVWKTMPGDADVVGDRRPQRHGLTGDDLRRSADASSSAVSVGANGVRNDDRSTELDGVARLVGRGREQRDAGRRLEASPGYRRRTSAASTAPPAERRGSHSRRTRACRRARRPTRRRRQWRRRRPSAAGRE